MMKKLFIDTGVWVALNNKRDKYYQHAVMTNRVCLDGGYFYVTSDYILDETFTLLRLDVGHKRAVEFGYEIKDLQNKKKINVFHVNQLVLDKAWQIFEKYSDKDFSFTDCSSFGIMEILKIEEVFSFDKHFDQYGFIRLPAI